MVTGSKFEISTQVSFEKAALSMYCAAASVASEEQMPKLAKLVTLWETKSKFFSDEVLDKMRNFNETFNQFKEELKNFYSGTGF